MTSFLWFRDFKSQNFAPAPQECLPVLYQSLTSDHLFRAGEMISEVGWTRIQGAQGDLP